MELYSQNEYLDTNLFLRSSIYKKELVDIQIKNSYFENISGHNVGCNYHNTFKSTFSEYFERINLVNYQNENLKCFRLSTGEEGWISKNRVFFTEDSFNDSCGVASHTNSIDCISNAFLEFIERQSLIFTWINKRKGNKLDVSEVKRTNLQIKEKIDLLKNFINNIYIFDISIYSSLHVIFGIGISKDNKCVGLSAHWKIESAISDTLDEMIEFFGSSTNKNKYHGKVEKKLQNDKSMFSYMNYFHNLSTKELIDKYHFLIESTYSTLENKKNNDVTITSIIKSVENEHKIEICATLIPMKFGNKLFKVVKVFSHQGYPHMNVPLFSDEDRTKYKIKNIEKQNTGMIPFP